MALKFVYVVVSAQEDYYADRVAISIRSLRKHNPGCHVIVLSDTDTVENASGTRGLFKEMADEVITKKYNDDISRLQRSRDLKTSIRQIVQGDFCFLDIDTIITGSLSDLENFQCDVSIALQRDYIEPVPEMSLEYTREYNKQRGIPLDCTHGITQHFNSGIIFCKDTPASHKLFEKWHSLWEESATVYNWFWDQADLNRANALLGNMIVPLDGIYNCMALGFRYAIPKLHDCRIFHYFSNSSKLSYLPVKSSEFLTNFRNKGFTKEVEDVIENIREIYFDGLYIQEKLRHEKLIEGIKEEYHKRPYTYTEKLANKVSTKIPIIEKCVAFLYQGVGKIRKNVKRPEKTI